MNVLGMSDDSSIELCSNDAGIVLGSTVQIIPNELLACELNFDYEKVGECI